MTSKAKTKKKARVVRAGTNRARILRLADGSRTLDQIAKAVKRDRANVTTALAIMRRDMGLSYSVGDDDRLVVRLPAGVTVGA
ncbi:hypothetical protein AUC71_07735 [Methyloceanibacter marginalis]|uniref:Transcriptional regulator n=1 Tax=Methyloceanibacter marginalis TaxID=1774971 RepID=A0A1E3WFI6_9HYPH|nr:hypothetical protein [Methyloceanibacter marginalis]ODS03787.1 hypothetical protein AUC71_07735 [Methyloceanibacter marginalis]